jgi:hypothetical protein
MRIGVILLWALCAATRAFAQASDTPHPLAADPLLKSTARSLTSGVALEFTTEEQTARAQIGSDMGSLRQWGFTISGPVAGKGKPTTLATGEGLAAGTSAEFLVRWATSPGSQGFTDLEFRSICQRYLKKPGCTRAELPVEGRQEIDAQAFEAVWIFGFSAKVGHTAFEFADPVTFADQSENHEGWSISGSAGRIQAGALASLLYYVGASFRHENAYVGNDEQDVCTPIGTSTSTVCREIAIGAPTRRKSELVQVEARSFPMTGLALAPRLTYEVNAQEWAFEMPMYVRQDDGPFSGGVSVGWDSERDDIHLSLFVGAFPGLFR